MSMIDISRAKDTCTRILDRVGSVFVGDKLLLTKLMAAMLAEGHVLFEDYPGLGKTLLAKVMSKALGCDERRVQFTPDLLPADLTGINIWRQNTSTFELMQGPLFTNILLADEINRTPPKTQAALLEAMEERQISIEGNTYHLDRPFIVLATQNPIELEGTYPLPEAQMDRFILRLSTGYARSVEEETLILSRRVSWKKDDPTADVEAAVSKKEFIYLQQLTEGEIYVDRSILQYISQLVRGTREHKKVEVGASPRGGLALLKLSRAMALMHGRDFVTPDDVKMFVVEALAHRIILDTEQALAGVSEESIVQDVLSIVPVPKEFHPR
jgi:MoxR-like ATPase